MEIKPPGSGKTSFESLKESNEVTKRSDKTFSTVKKDPIVSSAGSFSQPAKLAGLRGVSTQYNRKDLQQPEKVETIVRSSINELIDTEFPELENLHQADKKFLTDWMASDPVFRDKLIGYLERVLK